MHVIQGAHSGGKLDTPSPIAEPVRYIKCDRDQACDYAKFEIITPKGPVYLCGHHFHVNELAIMALKYKVRKVNG